LKKLVVQENTWHILISIVTGLVNTALFLFVGYQVWLGNLKLEDYSFYSGSLTSIIGCVGSIVASTATIYQGTLFIDNMILFMNEEKTIKPSLPEPAPVERHCGHTIVFDNVSFAYPGSDRKVLKNINLTLNPGDTAVLVGLNGAGKTTLLKILTRLYDPTEGTVYLDGRNIKEYDPKELYKIFGIIFQDFGKYAVSVSENIAFGDIENPIDHDRIKESAEQSNCTDFIEKLPLGFDTPLMRYFEQSGIELSIGQWQKLSVARAFYSDSDILILDEPTASLDPMAEQEIFSQFDKLAKDKTTIFVSHRLSSATTANKIIVLKYGEIIETGTHKDLMEKKGEYYTLFSTQARRYISSENESVLEDTEDMAPLPGHHHH
jgi:ABC-type multidrug transport system fused ATPase/permease subunit